MKITFKNCPFSFSTNQLITLIEVNKNRNISPFEGERIIKRIQKAGGPVRANEIFWFEMVCERIQKMFDSEIADGSYKLDYYTYERENFNYCADIVEQDIRTFWIPLV